MPDLPPVARCKSCDAPIRYVYTARSGALMPLDAVPDPEGNVVLDENGLAVVGQDLFLPGDHNVAKWMPHHATCPMAARHRKKP